MPSTYLLCLFLLLLSGRLNGAVLTATANSDENDESDTHAIKKRQAQPNQMPASVDRERLTKHHVRIRARVEPQNSYWPNRHTQVCPQDDIRILINGLDCPDAVDTHGHYLCYKYAHRFRSCCEKCIQLRDPRKPGCEYGDHSHQCKIMDAYLCYERQNREICCETCPRLQQFSRTTEHGCEYGDMTPQCKLINPAMCYRQDIQRLCCHTCPILRNQQYPECPYGDHDGFLCATLRLDPSRCYRVQTRQMCCNACSRLQLSIPDCVYGDHRVAFNTPLGAFGCEQYIRIYGQTECKNPTIKSRCCASCYNII